jgi:hypothetical protein
MVVLCAVRSGREGGHMLSRRNSRWALEAGLMNVGMPIRNSAEVNK